MGQIPIYGANKKGTRLYPFKLPRPERFELLTSAYSAGSAAKLDLAETINEASTRSAFFARVAAQLVNASFISLASIG